MAPGISRTHSRENDPFNPFVKPAPKPEAPVLPREPAPPEPAPPEPVPPEPVPPEPVPPEPQPPEPVPPEPPPHSEPVQALESEPTLVPSSLTPPLADAPGEEKPVPFSEPPRELPALAATPLVNPPQSAKSSPAVWILSVALAALAGLVGGYLLGWFAGRQETKAVPTLPTPQARPAPAEVPKVESVSPPLEEPEKVEEEAPPLKIIAAPEAALKAFLSAPDWRERARHVLQAEETAVLMESYHSEMSDGPVKTLSVKFNDSHGEEGQEPVFHSYRVATAAHPGGFPVAVVRTEQGWKVDWRSFVEFQDDHFSRFAGGQGGDTGKFHLLVRVTNFATPKIEGFSAFRLDPPMEGRDRYGFVPTDSELHRVLAAAAKPGHPAFAVLELKRHPAEGGKNWLEVTSIVAPNWWPESE